MEEASLKRLHAVGFHLYDVLKEINYSNREQTRDCQKFWMEGGLLQEQQGRDFGDYTTALYLNCGCDYTNLSMCKNSQNYILEKRSVFLYINLKNNIENKAKVNSLIRQMKQTDQELRKASTKIF